MAMLALLKRLGRRDITVHGFRSTFKDWSMEQTNFAHEVSEAALAHLIDDETVRAYARGDLFEKTSSSDGRVVRVLYGQMPFHSGEASGGKLTSAIRTGTTRRVLVAWPLAFKYARGATGRRCNVFQAGLFARVSPRRKAMLCLVLWYSPLGHSVGTIASNSMCDLPGELDLLIRWPRVRVPARSPNSSVSGRMPSGDMPQKHAVLFEAALVGGVDFVAMAVAFGNFRAAVDPRDAAAARQRRVISAKPHGAAEIAAVHNPRPEFPNGAAR
jgi:hypothetical protein